MTMTKRILLCDDEMHILRAAEFKFKRAGYEVRLRQRRPGRLGAIQRAAARHRRDRLPDAAAERPGAGRADPRRRRKPPTCR